MANAENNGSTYLVYEQAKEANEKIKNCRNTMQSIFDDVDRTMAYAYGENSTQGKVALALKNNFNSLRNTFTDYTRKIDLLYAELDKKIAAAGETEQKAASAAENLASK